jgi:hypothetical protein
MPRVAIVAAVAALASLAIPAIAQGGSSEPLPDRTLVRGSEFDLTLSKTKVRPGRVIVQFFNDGEDPHDLRLQRIVADGPDGAEFGTGELGPGEVENIDGRLKRKSTYALWCSISDHRGLGMEATLRTKKRKRPAR